MTDIKAYAEAILELDSKAVLELKEIALLFDEDLIKFLKSPKISKDEKKKLFFECLKNVEKNTLSFLYVLIDNNKIAQLKDILVECENIKEEQENIKLLEVISSKVLTKNDLQKLINYFSNKLNKIVKINNIVDENIKSGIIVKYDNKIIDASVIHYEESLKEFLKR